MRTKIKTKSCFPFPSREENLTFLAENETKKNGKVLFADNGRCGSATVFGVGYPGGSTRLCSSATHLRFGSLCMLGCSSIYLGNLHPWRTALQTAY